MTITPPFSDIGYKPITSTLVSYKLRGGQVKYFNILKKQIFFVNKLYVELWLEKRCKDSNLHEFGGQISPFEALSHSL